MNFKHSTATALMAGCLVSEVFPRHPLRRLRRLQN